MALWRPGQVELRGRSCWTKDKAEDLRIVWLKDKYRARSGPLLIPHTLKFLPWAGNTKTGKLPRWNGKVLVEYWTHCVDFSAWHRLSYWMSTRYKLRVLLLMAKYLLLLGVWQKICLNRADFGSGADLIICSCRTLCCLHWPWLGSTPFIGVSLFSKKAVDSDCSHRILSRNMWAMLSSADFQLMTRLKSKPRTLSGLAWCFSEVHDMRLSSQLLARKMERFMRSHVWVVGGLNGAIPGRDHQHGYASLSTWIGASSFPRKWLAKLGPWILPFQV